MEQQKLSKPYEGKDKYIFISYSHKDATEIFPIILHLQQKGYRVWYDEGIDPGNEWDESIAIHIQKATLMLAFISKNYLNSENCKDELNFARDEKIDRILIYIEDVQLPPGMRMRLGRQQAIYYCKYTNKNDFYEKLLSSDEMAQLRQKTTAPKTEQSTSKIPVSTDINPIARQTEKTTSDPVSTNVRGRTMVSGTVPTATTTASVQPKDEFSLKKPAATIESLCKDFVEKSPNKSLYTSNSEKLKKILRVPESANILISHDDTLMQTGKNGFMITKHGIYCKPLMEPIRLTLFTDIKNPSKLSITNAGILYTKMIAYMSGHQEEKERLLTLIKELAALVNKTSHK
ncbi:MAG: toll/interleukin-1 receptor domain-containing protein [Ruminococcaceae bacterium]|nr:toll/interleukin-1 receptor domain-containing protein [Oscillospiraceae bacterium]